MTQKVRELGMVIGTLPVGKKNCITDVQGVQVGHVTLDEKLDDVGAFACTGVTAILPHGGNLFQQKVTGASYVLNGFGKTTGLVQVNELGVIEAPIMLTNTFGVPAVTQGTLQYMLNTNQDIGLSTGTINLVVGECNDSYLNSIRACPITPEHALQAICNASENTAKEGAVGAGKGMICFGYKGGIGSASRIVTLEQDKISYTVGIIVLSNFGHSSEFIAERYNLPNSNSNAAFSPTDGSIIIVLATDAPLSSRQLTRVIKRCGIGLGRTGSHFSHGSGDIVIGFTTAHHIAHHSSQHLETRIQLREDHPIMNHLFTAAAEATEEAILNSLSQGQTTTGRDGHVVEAYSFKK
ncbi:P1 family peptidase [Lysinibacillus sphaericus]|uniref:Aminopeptidase n=1 Tax=Lysinibacillus sphaericus TaxID=1421 RepID=A0A2S0K1W0_LYSSH|nr:P1 family peptidase [Lysinibacillus sphaericus]AVK97254.1 aminopeptidase [Lysinibacillus sphaericus]MED4542557.1 P1 family peptidase [Lysinibacillus sphaericus]TKI20057.1 P1 family peptidase [Lysinibacillus sphaericus]SUV16854.1 peptidase S58 DmpA [Lysinibacillus sphaericus]GEC80341.1 aminopeptidase [Lysinibacillus sphaericus]